MHRNYSALKNITDIHRAYMFVTVSHTTRDTNELQREIVELIHARKTLVVERLIRAVQLNPLIRWLILTAAWSAEIRGAKTIRASAIP